MSHSDFLLQDPDTYSPLLDEGEEVENDFWHNYLHFQRAVAVAGLLALLDSHGSHALEAAIAAALREDRAHLGAVRHFIDQHAHARQQEPPLAVHLPDDPRLRALSVRNHPLSDYEHLTPQPVDASHNEPLTPEPTDASNTTEDEALTAQPTDASDHVDANAIRTDDT